MIIRYFYKIRKEWNCEKVCKQKEFEKWLEIDTKSGHEIVFNNSGYDCFIDA